MAEPAEGRRAPSSRSSKGNRMGRLLEQEEDEADKEFYTQAFWEDAEEDGEYDVDADDEDGADSFDSDFGDSTESEDDDDDEKADAAARKAERSAIARKKSVYQDPKAAGTKQPAAEGGAGSAKPRKKPKRSEAELTALQQNISVQRGSLRASTKDATALAAEKRRNAAERAAERAARQAEAVKSKGVELRRLTQEDILAEARHTELLNRASLEMMLRVEEEKRKTIVRNRQTEGPRVKTKSVRVGDTVVNTMTFENCEPPPTIDDVAPPYPEPLRCAVTGQPARYRDPATGCPYATLEAFRMLRGRSGRRNSFTPSITTAAQPDVAVAPMEL